MIRGARMADHVIAVTEAEHLMQDNDHVNIYHRAPVQGPRLCPGLNACLREVLRDTKMLPPNLPGSIYHELESAFHRPHAR